ncbi:MAG: FAA hydrolase family protein [Anaerolineae bacterium]|nr:MAG: FAA hydrolase family protein [Anaerolineae bacterium]
MKIVRYSTKGSPARLGWVDTTSADTPMVGLMDGSPYGEFRRGEPAHALADVKLHPPTLPSKILCVGRNYVEHAKEHDAEVPEVPLLFMKPPSALIGPGETIVLPAQASRVEHEAELAVIIGRAGRWIGLEDALTHVLGYTIANDVTARDLQRRDGQWTRGKGFDTFCPLGPWIETDFDPTDALITCKVNEETRQMASTRDMVFNVKQLIVFASSVMTLEPGDILLTGTPAGVGPLEDGNHVTIAIEGLGELKNEVRAETR